MLSVIQYCTISSLGLLQVNIRKEKIIVTHHSMPHFVTTIYVQVAYMAMVGSFPFNSFLSGILSCVGTAVLAGVLFSPTFLLFLQQKLRFGLFQTNISFYSCVPALLLKSSFTSYFGSLSPHSGQQG
jgi:DAD family